MSSPDATNRSPSILPLARPSTVTPVLGASNFSQKRVSRPRKLREAWKYYCHTARVAGLPYLGGYKKHRCLSRLCWAILFLAVLFITIKICFYAFTTYQYSIRTSTMLNEVSVNEFPAITICPTNTLPLDAVCHMVYLLALQSSATNYDLDRTTALFRRRNQCRNKSSQITDVATGMKAEKYMDILGVDDYLRLFAYDHRSMVSACWWNNEEIKCDEIFITHTLLDNRLCFTFNANSQSVENSINETSSVDKEAQNLPPRYHKPYYVFQANSKTGLRLILNAMLSDLAETAADHRGSGFEVFIHDRGRFHCLSKVKSLSLAPGYSYSVSLSSTNIVRRTEHLGFCNRSGFEFEDCLTRCFYLTIYRMCRCWPDVQLARRYAMELGVNLVQQCIKLDEEKCLNRARSYILYRFDCNCKQPCMETVYEYRATKNKLQSNVPEIQARKMGSDATVVSFQFETMTTTLIVESQAFVTISDMWVNVGRKLKIWLGVSFTFLAELCFYVLISLCSVPQLDPFYRAQKRGKNISTGLRLEAVPSTSTIVDEEEPICPPKSTSIENVPSSSNAEEESRNASQADEDLYNSGEKPEIDEFFPPPHPFLNEAVTYV